MTKSLSTADVKLSKGQAPKLDPRLVVRDVHGRVVAVWTGRVSR